MDPFQTKSLQKYFLSKVCPKWHQVGPGGFVPTNVDLADVLGNTDFDLENFCLVGCFGIPNFLIFRFQISRFPEIWPGPGLGWAWARPGRTGPGRGLRKQL